MSRVLFSIAVAAAASSGCGGDATSAASSSAGGASSSTGIGAGAAGGGGSAPVDHGTFRSGSRLRATYLDAADGAVELLWFVDTTLGVQCDFMPFTDGSIRCVPWAAFEFYDNDACTGAPLLASDRCGTQRYGIEWGPGSCAVADGFIGYGARSVMNVYEVGSVVSPPHVWQLDLGGHCSPAHTGGLELRKTGSAVSPDLFVDATASKVVHGRAEVTTYVGSDGSNRLDSTRDATLGFACDFYANSCLPPLSAYALDAYESADSGCTERAAFQALPYDGTTCGPPTVIVEAVPDPANTCTDSYRFYTPGPEAPTAYVGVPGVCMVDPGVSGERFYAFGDAIPENPYFTAVYAGAAGGRVQVLSWQLPDGTPLQEPYEFLDTQTQQACYRGLDDEHQLRCITDQPSLALPSAFSDAACTQPIESAGADLCAPDPYPPYVDDLLSPTCVDGVHLARYGARYAVVPYQGDAYSLVAGKCTALTPFFGTVYYTKGARLDYSSFPTMQVVKD